jgi:hypothetical protein
MNYEFSEQLKKGRKADVSPRAQWSSRKGGLHPANARQNPLQKSEFVLRQNRTTGARGSNAYRYRRYKSTEDIGPSPKKPRRAYLSIQTEALKPRNAH